MRRIFILVTFLIVYASLYPGNLHFRALEGGPFIYLSHRWDSWANSYLVRDIPANLALYLPFGFFALLARSERRGGPAKWHDWLIPVPAALLLSSAMETLQIYEQGRSSSAVDITCNTAGAALGVMLAAITRRVSVPDRLLICHLPVYVPQLILGVTAFAFLWPFHFTPVPNPVSLVPFALLISGDGPRGLLAMGQTLAAAVISIWSLRASGRSLAWSTLIAAAVMCGIETGRIFIPGASPGTTNPLLVLLTGYALGGVEFESGSGWGKATNR